MRGDRRYIWRWLSGMLMLLLLTACSGSSSEGGEVPVPAPSPSDTTPDKPVLKIYIFPPNRPAITRAGDLGNVDASAEENKIHSLHVWVFERDESNLDNSLLVGYVSMGNLTLSDTGNGEVTMEITSDFADEIMSNSPPKVDIYVAANVTSANCGISFASLTNKGVTTEGALKDQLIESGYFGVTSPVQGVPTDGLPMSGVLKNQQISGNYPVFRVGSADHLSNVQLVRAVSKMRFVFCKTSENNDNVTVNNIILNGGKLPKEEYLFLTDDYSKVTPPKLRVKLSETPVDGDYESEATFFPSVTDVVANNSPSYYSYDGVMSGQEYENRINEGVTNGDLSDLGTFYLRESDQALSGVIKYAITPYGTTTQNVKTTTSYSMKNAGDFSRNHTWIVYGYFVSNEILQLNVVELKSWESSETQGNLYNW